MAQYVLNIKGLVVPWRTLRRFWPDELSVSNVTEGRKRYIFDKAICNKLGDSYSLAPSCPDNELAACFEDLLSEDKIPPDLPYIITGEEATTNIREGNIVDALASRSEKVSILLRL